MTNTVRAFYKNGAGPTLLKSPDDVDALIDAVLAEPFKNSVIALYSEARPPLESGVPDHELRIAIDAEAGVGGVRYYGDDGTDRGVWYAVGKPSHRDDVFYYYQGNDEGWPQDSELPLDDVRTAIREFVALDGARPTATEWSTWPVDVA